MDLKSRFVATSLSTRADQLVALAKPCIRLHRSARADWLLPVGSSKIGGCPDVPKSFEWPSWQGTPLAFLAQLDLSNLVDSEPAAVLPRSGLLSFFYDAEQQTWGFDPQDRGGWRVLYFSPEEALARCPFPNELPDDAQYPACRVGFYEAISIAPYESADIARLKLSKEEVNAYFEVLDGVTRDQEGQPLHQVLGHPDPIQGDMQLECQLASNGLYCGDSTGYQDPRRAELELSAAQWQLLFQLDSDDQANMMWGDVGRLYFWIRQADLQHLNFGGVWMVLQCG